ncbi:translational machinery component [Fistulina hepatica ATCC 64428]|uniref:Translational machinery component n=1 Tax=Fistulina hepatica ATCC 64428 TaxID=1128425 RepID=A0A0D7A4C1_9AGAR|nr:translational machinery component [Fistulina hepatica ATCC 64428]
MGNQPQWTTPVYRLHCKATNNNVILNFTKSNGDTILWVSGGKIGFTNVRRSTYEAGYQCAVKVIKAIEVPTIENAIKLELFLKGFGQGREALINTLNGVEGQKVKPYVSRLTDRTPIKIGGTRAPKMKRL